MPLKPNTPDVRFGQNTVSEGMFGNTLNGEQASLWHVSVSWGHERLPTTTGDIHQ
jgi:hypothetical protein